MKGTLEERFREKVAFLGAGPDDCWEWRGAKNRGGYGVVHAGGQPRKILKTHRVSWELANGPIPEGMCVLHHCDTPNCVNPRHLFLGTIADNNQDMKNKGRGARGEQISQAKLTEQGVHGVRRMLRRGVSPKVIADKSGVSTSTISLIKLGKRWGWLKEDGADRSGTTGSSE